MKMYRNSCKDGVGVRISVITEAQYCKAERVGWQETIYKPSLTKS